MKTCKTCKSEKSIDDFSMVKKTGRYFNDCKKCLAEKAKERQHRLHPEKPYYQARDRDTATGETQTCYECDIDKDLCKFPPATEDRTKRQKTCDECQDRRTAERKRQMAAGERVKNGATDFHHPVVDGKKQCRVCETWKVLETEFMTRNTPHGYFHECRDCRRISALDYARSTFNAILKERRESDEAYQRKERHRWMLYKAIKSPDTKAGQNIEEDSGVTGKILRKWIEYQFNDKLSWTDYGHHGDGIWSIDHVIPLFWFDLKKESHRSVAFSWVNIQPLVGNYQKHTTLSVDDVLRAASRAEEFIENSGEAILSFEPVTALRQWLDENIT